MNNSELTTRILAVALALFLWAYVRVQHDMPDVQRVMQNVPVTLEGKPPAGLAPQLREEDRTITVQIKGQAERVNTVLLSEVKARVELSSINKSGTEHLPVAIDLPHGVQLAQSPQDVTLITRALTQKDFPVTISFIASPPPGTTVGEYLIEPSTVTVEGPTGVVDKVKYVTVFVDPNEPMTTDETLVPHARDADGDLVEDARLLNSAVSVSMSSLTGPQETRQVAIRAPELRNQPRNYTVSVAQVTPDVVTLSGEAALLEKQAILETEPIDVHHFVHDITVTTRIRVPAGLTVVNKPDIRVDLRVQPLGR